MAEEKTKKVIETQAAQPVDDKYTVHELVAESANVFGVPSECAVAAFRNCGKGKTEMTVAEAKQLIDRFMKKEVK